MKMMTTKLGRAKPFQMNLKMKIPQLTKGLNRSLAVLSDRPLLVTETRYKMIRITKMLTPISMIQLLDKAVLLGNLLIKSKPISSKVLCSKNFQTPIRTKVSGSPRGLAL
jgi:hypothetical protein